MLPMPVQRGRGGAVKRGAGGRGGLSLALWLVAVTRGAGRLCLACLLVPKSKMLTNSYPCFCPI